MKVHLTERFVRTVEPPHDRNIIIYDDEVALFGFRITEAGSKSFILTYRVAGSRAAHHHRLMAGLVRYRRTRESTRVKRLIAVMAAPISVRPTPKQLATKPDTHKACRSCVTSVPPNGSRREYRQSLTS